jgi:DNA-binding transcriptional MerR regulator
VIGRLRLLQVAREAGFSIAETRTFVAGFSATTPPAIRWRTLAKRKLEEIEAQMSQLERMKVLLESGFHCQCLSIEDCARIIGTAPLPSMARIVEIAALPHDPHDRRSGYLRG